MSKEKLNNLIDKVTGKDGPLRVPAYWMRKLLYDIVEFCKKQSDDTIKLIPTKVSALENDSGYATNITSVSTGAVWDIRLRPNEFMINNDLDRDKDTYITFEGIKPDGVVKHYACGFDREYHKNLVFSHPVLWRDDILPNGYCHCTFTHDGINNYLTGEWRRWITDTPGVTAVFNNSEAGTEITVYNDSVPSEQYTAQIKSSNATIIGNVATSTGNNKVEIKLCGAVYPRTFMDNKLLKELTFDNISDIPSDFCNGCSVLRNLYYYPAANAYVRSGAFKSSAIEYIETNSNYFTAQFANETASPFNSGIVKYFRVNYKTQSSDFLIPENVTQINNYAFYKAAFATTLDTGDEVQAIGQKAFSNNTTLTRIRIGKKVNALSNYAFEYLSPGCTVVWDSEEDYKSSTYNPASFANCELIFVINTNSNRFTQNYSSNTGPGLFDSTTLLHIKCNGLKRIGEACFYNNKGVVNDIDLSGIESIGQFAFQLNTGLTELIIPDSVVEIGISAFRECSRLERVEIGNGIESLPTSAFRECISLKQVFFGQSVREIGDYCFENSKPDSLVFPRSLENIASNAFTNCATRYFNFLDSSSIPTLESTTAFSGIAKFAIIVPNNLYSDWIAATNWASISDHIISATEVLEFSVVNLKYTAVSGQSWEDFIGSSLNFDDFYIEDGFVYMVNTDPDFSGAIAIIHGDGSKVTQSDIIEPKAYSTLA